MASSDTPDDLADLPPSAELVYRVLCEQSDPVTIVELTQLTCRHRRTIEEALKRLQDAGLVASRPNVGTPSQRQWHVETRD